ncbi:hypothetical protein ACLB2K_041855 [Fragaria x ananassa]
MPKSHCFATGRDLKSGRNRVLELDCAQGSNGWVSFLAFSFWWQLGASDETSRPQNRSLARWVTLGFVPAARFVLIWIYLVGFRSKLYGSRCGMCGVKVMGSVRRWSWLI